MTAPAPEATPRTQHPITTVAGKVLYAFWYADLRDLPMPFSFSGTARGHIILNFHTREDVVAWAEDMDVDLTSDVPNVRASGVALDVPLTVVAFVPEVGA